MNPVISPLIKYAGKFINRSFSHKVESKFLNKTTFLPLKLRCRNTIKK